MSPEDLLRQPWRAAWNPDVGGWMVETIDGDRVVDMITHEPVARAIADRHNATLPGPRVYTDSILRAGVASGEGPSRD